MFKREIWDKYTEDTFLKFWNLKKKIKFWDFKISKNERDKLSQISRINMWFLVNHVWQALKEYNQYQQT